MKEEIINGIKYRLDEETLTQRLLNSKMLWNSMRPN